MAANSENPPKNKQRHPGGFNPKKKPTSSIIPFRYLRKLLNLQIAALQNRDVEEAQRWGDQIEKVAQILPNLEKPIDPKIRLILLQLDELNYEVEQLLLKEKDDLAKQILETQVDRQIKSFLDEKEEV